MTDWRKDCKACEHYCANNHKPLCLKWTKHFGHIYSLGWNDDDGYDNHAPWCQFFERKEMRL